MKRGQIYDNSERNTKKIKIVDDRCKIKQSPVPKNIKCIITPLPIILDGIYIRGYSKDSYIC